MRLTTAVAFLALASAASAAKPPTTQVPKVESLRLAADDAGPDFRLLIEAGQNPDANGPELRLIDPLGRSRIIAPLGLSRLTPANERDAAPIAAPLRQYRLWGSNYVLADPALARAGARGLIVFGWNGEPDPDSLILIVLHHDAADVRSIGPLNLEAIVPTHDGVELVGMSAYHEAVDEKCRSTYDPYSVHLVTLARKRSEVSYSEPLSRAYNEAHYVWAGPKSRADVTVDTCGPKPRLVRARAP